MPLYGLESEEQELDRTRFNLRWDLAPDSLPMALHVLWLTAKDIQHLTRVPSGGSQHDHLFVSVSVFKPYQTNSWRSILASKKE